MAKCQEGNSEWCVICLPFMERGRRETGIFLYEHVFMYTYAYVGTHVTCIYMCIFSKK